MGKIESQNLIPKNSYKEALHLDVYEIAFCLIYFVTALSVCFYLTPLGPCITGDSFLYLDAGEKIYEDFGYVLQWSGPPAYPTLIAFGIGLGLTPIQSAGITTSLFYALLAFPLFILGKIIDRSLTGYITCIICLLSFDLLKIATIAWTEMTYLFFSIWAIIFLSIYKKYKNFELVLFAGVFSSIACMSRYIGISLILTGIIIIIISNYSIKRTLSHLILYLLISIIPLFPKIAGKSIGWHQIGYATANNSSGAQSIIVFIAWFKEIFFFNSNSKPILLLVLILFVLSLLIIYKKNEIKAYLCNKLAIIGYLLSYSTMLIIAASSTVISVPDVTIDGRKLIMIFPFVVLFVISTFDYLYNMLCEKYTKIIWKGVLIFLLILFISQQASPMIDHASFLKRNAVHLYQQWDNFTAFRVDSNITINDEIIVDCGWDFRLGYFQKDEPKETQAKFILYRTISNKTVFLNRTFRNFDISARDLDDILGKNTSNLFLYSEGIPRDPLLENINISHQFGGIISKIAYNKSQSFIIYLIERSRTSSNLSYYKESIKAYIELLNWNARGVALENARNYNESLKAYDKAIELDPTNRALWIAKGRVQAKMGNYDDSLKTYDKVIDIDSNNKDVWTIKAWIAKAQVLGKIGNFNESIEAYDKAIEIVPKDSSIWITKGYALENARNYNESLKSYEKAIQLDPNNKALWTAKARILRAQSRNPVI